MPSNCVAGEYSCQAKEVCESVTSEACVHQAFDCVQSENGGSWYPESGTGSYNFNFAYDFDGRDYGNICACDDSQMTKYGLANNHQYCGSGHWYRQ